MTCRFCTIALTTVGFAALTVAAVGFTAAPTQTAPAAAQAPAAKSAQSAAPLAFVVDDVHSLALFRVHHVGASQFWGRFNSVDGSFAFTPGSADGMKFDITIKAESVDTGVDKLDQHLRSADFFAAKDFPNMTFVSTGARKTGENTYALTGNLTIRGTTKEITADLEYTGLGAHGQTKKAGFEAIFTIQRGDFGVNYMLDNGGLGKDVRVVVCLEGNEKSAK